eukprot:1141768-Pyramimonas_sp.AAC.1
MSGSCFMWPHAYLLRLHSACWTSHSLWSASGASQCAPKWPGAISRPDAVRSLIHEFSCSQASVFLPARSSAFSSVSGFTSGRLLRRHAWFPL